MSYLPTYKLYILIENDSELKKLYEDQITDRKENKVTDSGFDLFLPQEEKYNSGKHLLFDHKIKCISELSNFVFRIIFRPCFPIPLPDGIHCLL